MRGIVRHRAPTGRCAKSRARHARGAAPGSPLDGRRARGKIDADGDDRGQVSARDRDGMNEVDPDDLDTRITTPISTPETRTVERAAWTGQRVGRYHVLERLGAGGMGEVYLAYDPELDRRVALKLLRRDRQTTQSAQDRLVREAQALAKLSHPNVVAVHDVGTMPLRADEPPTVYVAMEYVEGQTLRQWLATQTDWRTIARTYHAAGLGLAAAHKVGIVHRDFKPTNVIVGDDGRVRVLDFGLARRLHEGPLLSDDLDSGDRAPDMLSSHSLSGGSLELSLTQTGIVLGTPAYMAPEQFRGTEVDARGDQFAFCVALYEALFGIRPFGGREPGKILRAIRRQELREPKKHARIPKRLRHAIRKGLSLSPSARHPDLGPILAALESAVRPVSRAVVGVGALGIAAAGLAWWAGTTDAAAEGSRAKPDPCQGARDRLTGVWDQPRRAELYASFRATGLSYAEDAADKVSAQLDDWAGEWTASRTDACVATRVRGDRSAELMDLSMACLDDRLANLDALVDALSAADAQVVENAVQSAWGLPALAPCADATYLRAAVRPPDDPAVASTVEQLRTDLAAVRATVTTGKYGEGADAAVELVARTRPVGYEPLRAEVALMAGQALERAGRLAEVREYLEESLYAAERIGYGRVEAEALIGLAGFIGYQSADLENGQRFAEHARAVIERIDNPPRFTAALEVALANMLLRGGKAAEAVQHYDKALAIPISDATMLRHNFAAAVNVGTAHAVLGDDRAALAALEIAASRTLAELGPRHPTYGTAVMNIGATHWRMGELERATEVLAQAKTILEGALGEDHPQLARVLHNQGAVFFDQGKLEQALQAYDAALRIKRKLHEVPHPTVALTAANKGDPLLKLGRYEEADASLREAIEQWEASVGPEHPDIALALTTLGRVRLAQKRPSEAVELLERASKLRAPGASDRDLWEQDLALAQALHDSGGDRARALELARRAQAHGAKVPSASEEDRRQAAALIEALGGAP